VIVCTFLCLVFAVIVLLVTAKINYVLGSEFVRQKSHLINAFMLQIVCLMFVDNVLLLFMKRYL
jgi:hypothetical protein